MQPESIFGELQFAGSDTSWPGVKCDKLALGLGGQLLFASVLADAGIVKGIRAALNSDKRVTISASGLQVKKASDGAYTSRTPDTIGKIDGGYTTYIHRLEFGQAHAFFVTRAASFMPGLSDEHLWASLTRPEFTTPILPEWIGYLKRQLLAKNLLREASCYRCECGGLLAASSDLDLIVTEGLESGEILVPRKVAS